MLKEENKNIRWFLLAAALIIFLPTLYRPLSDNNEGLYAEVSREMLETGEFLVPQVNYLPYIEKPPLLYWLAAASYNLFGINEFAARMPSAISAFLILVVLYRFARQRVRQPLLAPLMLLTSLGFYIMSQLVMFDMIFTLFHTLCLLCFFKYIENKNRPGNLYLCFAACAAACLTKGLIGLLLPLTIASLFIFLTRERGFSMKHLVCGSLIFLILFLPWHIWMSIRMENFFHRYFIEEHILRFLGERIPKDYRSLPVYSNLMMLLLGIFPWTPFFIAALVSKRPAPAAKLDIFLLVWIAVYLFFFTVSQTSSTYYMLPVYPAMSLYMAAHLDSLKKSWLGGFVFGLSIFLLAAALILGIDASGADRRYIGGPYLLAVVLLYLAFLSSAYFYYGKGRLKRIGASSMLALSGFIIAALLFVQTHRDLYSSKDIALAMSRRLKDQDMVFIKGRYEDYSSFGFYLRRKIFLLDQQQGDLYYGISRTSNQSILVQADRLRVLIGTRKIFVLGRADKLANVLELGQFSAIGQDRRKVILESSLAS